MLKQWQFLKKSFELGKVSHAYLFYGAEAESLKRTALDFAKLVNCQGDNLRTKDLPCGACRPCKDMKKMTHPDLAFIEPEDPSFAPLSGASAGKMEIKIAQIRDLKSRLSLRAFSAPFKIAIVNQAHFLNQEAQSAFLKLLEEPKGSTVFILLTQYPEMLLPTILSRLERLRFYSFTAKFEPTETQKKFIGELLRVKSQNLAPRFEYAKKLAEAPQNLKEILDTWVRYLRELLLVKVNSQPDISSVIKLKNTIQSLQATSLLISTTNVNPRLALEIFMLNL